MLLNNDKVNIKICGLRRIEDIEIINKYDIDYAGFVFAESKRKVTIEEARLFISKLRKDIKRVGVFVNCDIYTVRKTAEICGLDIIQLHGKESINYIKVLGLKVWKAFSVTNEDFSINEIDEYSKYSDAILFDNGSGGTGKAFQWNLIEGMHKKYKVVLAGGLNPSNVKEAINKVIPFCVDVSSGVEENGFKNENKIAEFIYAVKNKNS